MNSEKNQPNSFERVTARLAALLVVFVALWLIIALAGCTTVTPRTVKSNTASWDGTNQNSGVIGFVGMQPEVTPHWRDRYNGLISVYSKRFLPPLTPDYGITATSSNTFLVTPEAFRDFTQMNRWRKAEPK